MNRGDQLIALLGLVVCLSGVVVWLVVDSWTGLVMVLGGGATFVGMKGSL